MKREYFGMLFMIAFVGLFLTAEYFIGEAQVSKYLTLYIVVWVMLAFYAGQYSMKFPKHF